MPMMAYWCQFQCGNFGWKSIRLENGTLRLKKKAPGEPEASYRNRSKFQDMSGDPVLGMVDHGDERLHVIETERTPIEPFARLIL